MTDNTRLYVATIETTITNRIVFVEASNPAQVRNHIARDMINVRVPTTKEVAAFVAAGGKIVKAGTEQPTQEPT